MLKKITNIGDCGITCDFGDEVNKSTNKEVIKLFNIDSFTLAQQGHSCQYLIVKLTKFRKSF